MAFSPFPTRPWPFEWVPMPPAQDWYGAGHQLARKRWMMATFLQLFLEVDRSGREALRAIRENCPRRFQCALRMVDQAGAIVRYLQQWGFAVGAAHRVRPPETLPAAIAMARTGSRVARGLASRAPLTPDALGMIYNLATAILRWASRQKSIPAGSPPPWRPRPRLRPVDCLTGAEGCN